MCGYMACEIKLREYKNLADASFLELEASFNKSLESINEVSQVTQVSESILVEASIQVEAVNDQEAVKNKLE